MKNTLEGIKGRIIETEQISKLEDRMVKITSMELYDVDRGLVMEPMQVKLASSEFDFGYTEQFAFLG